MLSPYRVVDLADERGLLCGQILADLGADVIAVEPPGGSSARRLGPFARDEPGAESSLFWWSYSRNKRSVVLDPDSPADREALLQLADGADFWIESSPPGHLASRGLGYADLRARNPGLVYVSITPFGQDGPRADWAASDLTIAAASGVAHLSGEPDRPPVRVSVPQAHAHAGADAAVGALIAHAARQRTGVGQHVDVSLQQSLTLATMFRALDGAVEQVPASRQAGAVRVGKAILRTRYPLRDGWVVLGPAFLPSTGHFMKRLLEWAHEEGFGERRDIEEDWSSFAARLVTSALPADAYDSTDATLEAFFASRTRHELMRAAVERKLLLAPILGVEEIIESAHLIERDFPVEIDRPDGAGTARFPGAFARFTDSPLRYRHPPPRLDEHGPTIRAEPVRAVATPPEPEPTPRLPLAGVKILDLFWVLAGPGATRMLADYGATVVRVESTQRVDTLRVIQPYRFSEPHIEGSSAFQSANANKLGVTLDVSTREGREVALDLARWADVVTESFAPGVIDRYGLGYESLRAVNPALIMISSCLMGQTGPWADLTGFGNLAASVTGFQQLASWPDRPPSGPFGAYTDFIAVRYNAVAILGALEYRRRTGRGQYIDQSQAEAALHFLAPAFLDHTVNGRAPEHVGNADLDQFPHDMFPTQGDDRWVAISVATDAQWEGLCTALCAPELRAVRSDRSRVMETIATWTRARTAQECEAALQAHRVPAHAVVDTPSMFDDPQLRHRDHFLEVAHEIFPTTWVESTRLRLSEAEALVPERALHFGRDNRAVLECLLEYSPERIAGLAERGVLL